MLEKIEEIISFSWETAMDVLAIEIADRILFEEKYEKRKHEDLKEVITYYQSGHDYIKIIHAINRLFKDVDLECKDYCNEIQALILKQLEWLAKVLGEQEYNPTTTILKMIKIDKGAFKDFIILPPFGIEIGYKYNPKILGLFLIPVNQEVIKIDESIFEKAIEALTKEYS
jgi:hypothetical protein